MKYKIPLLGGAKDGAIATVDRPIEYYEVLVTPREPVVHYTADTPLPDLPPMIPITKLTYKLERFRKPTDDGYVEKWRYVLWHADTEQMERRKAKALKGIEW